MDLVFFQIKAFGEKGFQNGGQKIRDMGVRLESLAIVDSMTDDSLTFRE